MEQTEQVDHKDLIAYINRYKQVNLLREIEAKFGAANYLNQNSSAPNSKIAFKSGQGRERGATSLAAIKRNRPTPGVGHYDDVPS